MHLKVNEEMIFSSGLGKSPWSYSWTRVETTGANECAHWHHSPLFYEYSECLETCAFVSPPPPSLPCRFFFRGRRFSRFFSPRIRFSTQSNGNLDFLLKALLRNLQSERILTPRSIWLWYYSFQFLLTRSMEIGMKRKTFPVGKHPVTSDSWHGVR